MCCFIVEKGGSTEECEVGALLHFTVDKSWLQIIIFGP